MIWIFMNCILILAVNACRNLSSQTKFYQITKYFQAFFSRIFDIGIVFIQVECARLAELPEKPMKWVGLIVYEKE